MLELAQGLADILEMGNVSYIEEDRMDDNERGWSGAEVIRKKVFLSDGTSTTMIFKLAELKERCVMKRLTEQGHQCTPAAYSKDVITNKPKWMVMEDLGKPKIFCPENEIELNRVANSICAIHVPNMGKDIEMPWLPVADNRYWKDVVTKLSVDHFERKMEQDLTFYKEFGKYLPKLREIGNKFVNDMTAISNETEFMTLTHGDLQMRDGAHVYDQSGAPYIIDFGFCRYAPLYIDLAGWFTKESIRVYHKVLCDSGVGIKYSDFEERAITAFRYTGFIYLCPSVIDWQNGPTEQKGKRILQVLNIILSGDFPERKRAYSNELFERILSEHKHP